MTLDTILLGVGGSIIEFNHWWSMPQTICTV